MSYAFALNASACSGCKACQEACKDKNNLPVGILWRRVIEVAGGEWKRTGNAWDSSVFAYHLSLACNHCVHPKCAGVCPTDAYYVRQDGIVLIDPSRCMGCDYCTWACPYGAPQPDRKHGIMTKCDFCHDRVDKGMPPSCVAACPLRVLNVDTVEESRSTDHRLNLWQMPGVEHPFPLPNYSRTEPRLAITPHTGMNSPLAKAVINLEELQPGSSDKAHPIAALHEMPLVGFTLLAQMAAGMAILSLVLSSIPPAVLFTSGLLLGLGGLISFQHLGRKRNGWRAVSHLRKSWLSREILLAILFGIAWIGTIGLRLFLNASTKPWLMALLGLGLIYCMAMVYRLRAVPAWNSWRTLAAFSLSTVVLGALGVNFALRDPRWPFVAGIGMVAEMGLVLIAQSARYNKTSKLRTVLLILGILGVLVMSVVPQANAAWLAIPVFMVALAEEIIGRWQFYAKRVPFPKLNIP